MEAEFVCDGFVAKRITDTFMIINDEGDRVGVIEWCSLGPRCRFTADVGVGTDACGLRNLADAVDRVAAFYSKERKGKSND